MRGRSRHVLVAVLLGVGPLACGGSDPAAPATDDAAVEVATATLGPVSARVTLDPPEPRFGDRVELVVEVTATDAAEPGTVEWGARVGHLRIRDRRTEKGATPGIVRHVLAAEPERTGTNLCRLPPIPFKVTSGEGAGSTRALQVPPFEIEVRGLSPDEEPGLADLGTPLGPVRMPQGAGGTPVWQWVALACALLGAGCLFWWLRRARRDERGEEAVDPRREAAWAFDALMAMGLIEQGRFGEFYLHLTGIVRRYIERTTGVHAAEQTTEEFLRAMETHPAFRAEQRARLTAFLESSDLVKFAAQVPTRAEVEDAIAAARSFCGLEAREEAA